MHFFSLSIKPAVQSQYEQQAAMSQTEFTTHRPSSSSWESVSGSDMYSWVAPVIFR